MLLYSGWIVAAFLMGVLVTLLLRERWPSLQRQAFRLGAFAGRNYAEILAHLKEPQTEERRNDGRIVRTWRGRHYSISLRFDERDMCQGVESEGR